MLIRRNTKAFKTIQAILTGCERRQDRKELVRVYITKAGESINERIDTTSIKGQADLFYEMTFQSVLGNLESSNHQLHESEETPGVFFFRRGANTNWDETPFEFDTKVKTEFSDLSDLPAVRKKSSSAAYVIPGASKTKKVATDGEKKKLKKEEKPETKKVVAPPSKPAEKHPRYKLKHEVAFSNLQSIVWSGSNVTKLEVLDYYDKVADLLIPYLRDRELSTRFAHSPSEVALLTVEALEKRYVVLPDWIHCHQSKGTPDKVLCEDRDHLLFLVQNGCLEFYASPARIKSKRPDYLVIQIDSPDFDLSKAATIAKEAEVVLNALSLVPLLKVDGKSGIHIHVPLDAKSDFEVAQAVGEYVCKLLYLKLRDQVALAGGDGYAYGKVTMDYKLEYETHFIAPWSLVMGDSVRFSAPIAPADLSSDVSQDEFTPDDIIKKKSLQDPFEKIKTKKVNAAAVLDMLEKYYAFLV